MRGLSRVFWNREEEKPKLFSSPVNNRCRGQRKAQKGSQRELEYGGTPFASLQGEAALEKKGQYSLGLSYELVGSVVAGVVAWPWIASLEVKLGTWHPFLPSLFQRGIDRLGEKERSKQRRERGVLILSWNCWVNFWKGKGRRVWKGAGKQTRELKTKGWLNLAGWAIFNLSNFKIVFKKNS